MDDLLDDMQSKGLVSVESTYPDSFVTGIVRCKANWSKVRMDLVCSVACPALDAWDVAMIEVDSKN